MEKDLDSSFVADASRLRDALEAIANLCVAAHMVRRDAHKDAAAFSTIFTLANDALLAQPAEASEAEQSQSSPIPNKEG